jgi:hypothetical protein
MRQCFCGRSARGFAYQDPQRLPFGETILPVPCCSMECLDVAVKWRGNMRQLNVDEKRAVNSASPEVGAYLDQIGKTDLATMTETEWLGFIAHAYGTVSAEVRKIWENEVPF